MIVSSPLWWRGNVGSLLAISFPSGTPFAGLTRARAPTAKRSEATSSVLFRRGSRTCRSISNIAAAAAAGLGRAFIRSYSYSYTYGPQEIRAPREEQSIHAVELSPSNFKPSIMNI